MKPALLICLLAALLTACASPNAPGSAPTANDSAPAPTARAAMRTPVPRSGPIATTQPPRGGSGAEPYLLAARVPRAQPGSKTGTAALANGLNGFAFDLYRAAVKGKDDNLIYSPYSIGMAFSMVYAGARGQTEAQMADVLGFLPQEQHHPAANGLERHLAALGTKAPPPGEGQGEAFRLNNANAVWGQRGYPFLDAYLRTLAEHYGTGVRPLDFQSNPEGGRKLVNDWVADQTEDRIRDIVPPGVINPQTRMVLANAIYFKAAWLFPFEKDATTDGPFTLLDGSRVAVPMMTQNMEPVPFAKYDDYQAVVLPYTGNTVDMVVIVPNAGRFDAIERRLSPGFLKNVRSATGRGSATITMPRFDFESDVPLTDLLPDMGMPDAFRDGTADFSGITGGRDLYISAALHRATIKVDEKGTEATAATVIAMDQSAAVAPPPHLTIDRPFIFAITERETGAILFLGRVTNPAK